VDEAIGGEERYPQRNFPAASCASKKGIAPTYAQSPAPSASAMHISTHIHAHTHIKRQRKQATRNAANHPPLHKINSQLANVVVFSRADEAPGFVSNSAQVKVAVKVLKVGALHLPFEGLKDAEADGAARTSADESCPEATVEAAEALLCNGKEVQVYNGERRRAGERKSNTKDAPTHTLQHRARRRARHRAGE